METDPEGELLETSRIETGEAPVAEPFPALTASASPEGPRWHLDACAAVGSLWAPGLAAFLIVAFIQCFGLASEKLEWNLYLGLGTLFPLLALGLWIIGRSMNKDSTTRGYQVVLGLAAIISIVWIWMTYSLPTDSMLTPMLALFTLVAYGAWLHFSKEESHAPLSEILIAFLVSVLSWCGAIRCIYWSPFLKWLCESGYTLSIFCLSVLVVTAAVFWKNERIGAQHVTILRRAVRCIFCCFAFGVFAALSFRTDCLFPGSSHNHWSFWIGPVESVRQGGWLLWDTPSQYGFLNILLVAAMPIKSAWESLYVVQAIVLLVVAMTLYFRLRQWGGGMFNYLFSLLTTATSVYVMAGWTSDLSGPQRYISVGPMRFVWCYLLMFALWICLDREPPRMRLFRWFGGVLWVCGVLWSAESAVYCTAVYGLAMATIVLQRSFQMRIENECAPPFLLVLLRTFVQALVAPVLLLAVALGIIYYFYLTRLGHPPDWRAYSEYALLYREGFGALPIGPDGPVWVLVVVFCILSALAAAFLTKKPLHPNLGLIMGAWGGVWAVSSYFVSRSHPNNVCNLMLGVVLGLAVALPTLKHLGKSASSVLLRHAAIPVFVICIAAIVGNPLLLTHSGDLWRNWRNVEERLPVSSSSLASLLKRGKVGVDDALVYDYKRRCLPPRVRIDSPQGKCLRSWLPQPLSMFYILPEKRRQVYLERCFEQSQLSGWLIIEGPVRPNDVWLLRHLRKTHSVDKTASVSAFTLYRCEPKTTPSP